MVPRTSENSTRVPNLYGGDWLTAVPLIQGGRRMRRSARMNLWRGRSAMVVPTPTPDTKLESFALIAAVK